MRAVEQLRGAAMVAVDGVVVASAAGGPTGPDNRAVCSLRTRFQVASVSKQFVAVALLLLAERDALGLDDPVARWLPDAPPQWNQVTIHHLLTHTAGVAHWGDDPGFDVFHPRQPEDRVRLILEAPLAGPTGQRWCYSSPGYLVLAAIAQRAARQPYAAFLAEQVFAPLGLTSTTVGGAPQGDTAKGIHAGEPAPDLDISTMAGTGDIWSTVEDLTRYGHALHNGALLSARTRRATTTPWAAVDSPDAADDRWIVGRGYGYGLFIGAIAGHQAYFHPGDVPGYVSLTAWLPEDRISIAILCNDDASKPEDLIKDLLPIAYG